MKLSIAHHVEYTGEGPEGHSIHGDFDQDNNDFKAAEKRAQLEVGPNVHLTSLRMWRVGTPKEYTVPHHENVSLSADAPIPPEVNHPKHLSIVENVPTEEPESEPIPVSAE